MILEGIFNLFFSFINFLISLLPQFDAISIPSNMLEGFIYIFDLCNYFLPCGDMVLIFGLWLSVVNGQFIYSLIMRLWDALPFT